MADPGIGLLRTALLRAQSEPWSVLRGEKVLGGGRAGLDPAQQHPGMESRV